MKIIDYQIRLEDCGISVTELENILFRRYGKNIGEYRVSYGVFARELIISVKTVTTLNVIVEGLKKHGLLD